MLERANVNSAEQLFQRVPTLTFRKGNTNKDSALSIRGVGTISFSSGVEPSSASRCCAARRAACSARMPARA
jgi:iron complex outermembrane recepter protein